MSGSSPTHSSELFFAQAAATAVLPSLSRQAVDGDHIGMGETFSHAMSLVLFLTIPAMVGLIVLREPIVSLLFNRGAFDAQATRLTSDALLYYALGLWAFSAVRIVVSTFYAMQDTRTPVKCATVAIAANILFGMALMGPMKHCGLALATSLASMVNLVPSRPTWPRPSDFIRRAVASAICNRGI